MAKDVPEIIALTAPAHAPNVINPWTGSQFLRVWSDSLVWVDATTRETVRQVRVPVGNAWRRFRRTIFPDCSCVSAIAAPSIDPDDGVILLRPEIEDRQGMLYREEVPIYGVFSADYSRLVVAFHMHLQLIDGVSGRLLSKRIAYSNALLKKSNPDQSRFARRPRHGPRLVWRFDG